MKDAYERFIQNVGAIVGVSAERYIPAGNPRREFRQFSNHVFNVLQGDSAVYEIVRAFNLQQGNVRNGLVLELDYFNERYGYLLNDGIGNVPNEQLKK